MYGGGALLLGALLSELLVLGMKIQPVNLIEWLLLVCFTLSFLYTCYVLVSIHMVHLFVFIGS